MLETADRWLHGLIRGDRPQTTRALRTPEGYCCLGDACELYRQETGDGQWVFVRAEDISDEDGQLLPEYDHYPEDEGGYAIDFYKFVLDDGTEAMTVLPEVVRRWLGMRTESGQATGGSGLHTSYDMLAYLNDHGSSFDEIASVVIRHPDWYLIED